MEKAINNLTFIKLQHEIIKDKALSRSALALLINGGVLIMLGLVANLLNDPVIYFLVISILAVGLCILAFVLVNLIFTIINVYLDTKDRLKNKNK